MICRLNMNRGLFWITASVAVAIAVAIAVSVSILIIAAMVYGLVTWGWGYIIRDFEHFHIAKH
jgi:hypothetical protein